jgi:hypothetical protein
MDRVWTKDEAMTLKNNHTDLVPVFIPSLVSVLMGRELDKGGPLTKQEVIAIRDHSTTIMLRKSEAAGLDTKRGYNDVNAARCWETWKKVRKTLKPLCNTPDGLRCAGSVPRV